VPRPRKNVLLRPAKPLLQHGNFRFLKAAGSETLLIVPITAPAGLVRRPLDPTRLRLRLRWTLLTVPGVLLTCPMTPRCLSPPIFLFYPLIYTLTTTRRSKAFTPSKLMEARASCRPRKCGTENTSRYLPTGLGSLSPLPLTPHSRRVLFGLTARFFIDPLSNYLPWDHTPNYPPFQLCFTHP
jgi:hypothetical protein